MKLFLCGAASALVSGVSLLSARDKEPADFKDLAECKTAYEELLAKYEKLKVEHEDLRKECGKETETTTPVPEPVTVDPIVDENKPEADKPISTTIGQPDKRDGKPIYKPPMGDSGKPDSEKGYDYKKHGEDWGTQFATCAQDGQSPVNFPKFIDIPGQTKSLLWFDYFLDDKVSASSELLIRNAGHGLYADLASQPLDYGFVKLLRTEYAVNEILIHTPSEHTIEGQAYPLEIQVYHKARDSSKMLGVSIMFAVGASNKFLKALESGSMPVWSVDSAGTQSSIGGIHKEAFDLENLLPMGPVHPGSNLVFYNYEGSLTYPPCTTGVDWWVLASPLNATQSEIDHLAAAIQNSESSSAGNNRKTQQLGKRTVTIGHTGFQHHGTGHRQPNQKKFPRQARGYTSKDHPWKPVADAHWSGAATSTEWKEGKDQKVKGSVPAKTITAK